MIRKIIKWYKGRKRRAYVQGMMSAINLALRCDPATRKTLTITDGLRVIKDFERINRCPIDPTSKYHMERIEGKAARRKEIRMERIAIKKLKGA
ncbi:MAG: hypothetical protein JXR97_06045 [Planctomycetes bacterium]|nr:hypothetical protein [Planctomycetota bacterium]